jgi:hypothetical protein
MPSFSLPSLSPWWTDAAAAAAAAAGGVYLGATWVFRWCGRRRTGDPYARLVDAPWAAAAAPEYPPAPPKRGEHAIGEREQRSPRPSIPDLRTAWEGVRGPQTLGGGVARRGVVRTGEDGGDSTPRAADMKGTAAAAAATAAASSSVGERRASSGAGFSGGATGEVDNMVHTRGTGGDQ